MCPRSGSGYSGPLCFRDEKTGVRFEIRRRAKPSIWYDLVDDADTDPEYAEQRDYIASIDVLIFVVDSQRERLEAGIGYFDTLRTALTRLGRDPVLLPVLFQLTKRDLPGVVLESELRQLFRAPRGAYVATCARRGEGIDQVIAAAVHLAAPDPTHT